MNDTKATIKQKQDWLLFYLYEQEILELHKGFAVFGIPEIIARPLIRQGLIHKETYCFTGGCAITGKGLKYCFNFNLPKDAIKML